MRTQLANEAIRPAQSPLAAILAATASPATIVASHELRYTDQGIARSLLRRRRVIIGPFGLGFTKKEAQADKGEETMKAKVKVPCEPCKASGRIEDQPCDQCVGVGYQIRELEKLETKIEPLFFEQDAYQTKCEFLAAFALIEDLKIEAEDQICLAYEAEDDVGIEHVHRGELAEEELDHIAEVAQRLIFTMAQSNYQLPTKLCGECHACKLLEEEKGTNDEETL